MCTGRAAGLLSRRQTLNPGGRIYFTALTVQLLPSMGVQKGRDVESSGGVREEWAGVREGGWVGGVVGNTTFVR